MVSHSEQGSVGRQGPPGMRGEQVFPVSKGDGACYPQEELPRIAPFHKSVEEFGEDQSKVLAV